MTTTEKENEELEIAKNMEAAKGIEILQKQDKAKDEDKEQKEKQLSANELFAKKLGAESSEYLGAMMYYTWFALGKLITKFVFLCIELAINRSLEAAGKYAMDLVDSGNSGKMPKVLPKQGNSPARPIPTMS